MEELELNRDCESCPVKTVTGEIADKKSAGYGVRNKVTFVWSTTEKPIKSECRPLRQFFSTGEMFFEDGIHRLRDITKEFLHRE